MVLQWRWGPCWFTWGAFGFGVVAVMLFEGFALMVVGVREAALLGVG